MPRRSRTQRRTRRRGDRDDDGAAAGRGGAEARASRSAPTRCIHLSDRAFAVADTLGTSRTLALAIQKEGDVDLVVCGRKTTDSETWQVPPETAAFLGWPHLTSVVETEVERRRSCARRARRTPATRRGSSRRLRSISLRVRRRDADGDRRRADRRLDGGRPRRRPARERQALRPDGLADARARRARRDARARRRTRSRASRTPSRRIRELLAERRARRDGWDKPDRLGEQPAPRAYDCWTFVELVDGRPSRPSLELLAKGRELPASSAATTSRSCSVTLDDVAESLATPRRRPRRRRRRSAARALRRPALERGARAGADAAASTRAGSSPRPRTDATSARASPASWSSA